MYHSLNSTTLQVSNNYSPTRSLTDKVNKKYKDVSVTYNSYIESNNSLNGLDACMVAFCTIAPPHNVQTLAT